MGLGGRKENWKPQVRAFKRYFRVISFDNRGVGGSSYLSGPITIGAMVGDTLALLDHLGIDGAHILGYSLGGIVAQEIAISHPERVSKLVLASTMAVGDGSHGSAEGLPKALGLKQGGGQQDLEGVDARRIMPVLADLAFNKWYYRLVIRFLARLQAQHIELEGLTGQFTAAAGVNTLDRVGSIQASTLVLTGTDDRLIDASASRVLASRIPHAKLVMIEGGSHSVAIEMRGRFNQAVLDFLGVE
jgi:pimeloyl-ACP methyl ester carboxylesterase